ncbi:hypothetical protein [Dapis sp. BLCC M172]
MLGFTIAQPNLLTNNYLSEKHQSLMLGFTEKSTTIYLENTRV